jgi:hypothetical protein
MMQYSPSDHITYSRDLIPADQEVLPYTLSGVKRLVFLAIYFSIVSISIGCVIYSLCVSPAIGVFGLLTAYLCNNVAFALGHVRFHTSFIELPESKMEILLHNSLIHHYRDVQIYHKNWLESRMGYFVDPKDGVFSSVFFSMIPGTLFVSWLLYRQHPILGITYFSTVWSAELLQSTIHEWYHNPAKNRKAFYSPVIYWTFTLLEKIGVASTKDHLRHHRHRLHNLNEVEKWLDLYLPFGERLPTLIWKKALSKYVPGKANMTAFVTKVIYVSYVSIHLMLSLAYLAVYPILK